MKKLGILLGILLISSMFAYSINPAYAITTIDVDISGSLNTTDEPFGIECSDDTYVYETLSKQGAIVRINKSTLATQIINDAETNASGEEFYSIARNPTNGDLLINKADKGEFVIYHNPSAASPTTEKHPLIQEVVHASVSYPSTYQGQPNLIKVTAEPVHGDHTYQFGIDSRSEAKFTNGNFWVLLDDVRDFDANAESLGVTDVSFHGIVKINPSTFAATRIAISATSMNGLAIDSANSTILWVTSLNDNKLFKFNTNTETVVDTISLPSGTKPRGLVTDDSFIYMAMNQVGGSGQTSKILKVDKSNTSSQTEIDTGASNTNTLKKGTFAVTKVGKYIGWSDESGHIGLIDVSGVITAQSKTVVDTTSIDSNRFMCSPDNGNTIWVAGKGSVKTTILSVPSDSSDDSGGDSGKKYLGRPTMGLSHQTGNQIVDFGLYVNENKYSIIDNFYTPTEKIPIIIGEPNNFGLKTFVGDAQVLTGEISLVPEVGMFHKAEVRLESHFNFDKSLKEIKVFQKDHNIDESIISSYQIPVDCIENSTRNDCVYIAWDNVVFMEKPIFEKVALNVINDDRRYQVTYLNDGFSFTGIDSLNPPLIKNAVVERGQLEPLTRIDKVNNLWQSESEIIYWQNDFGTFIRLTPYTVVRSDDIPQIVMTRNHSDFDELISYEKEKATILFDGNEIQAVLPDPFSYTFNDIDSRTQFLIDHNLMSLRK